MASSELTMGGLRSPESEQRRLAAASSAYNQKTFPKLFDGDIDAAFARAEEARKKAATQQQTATSRAATFVSKARAKELSNSITSFGEEVENDEDNNSNINNEDKNDDEDAAGKLPELTSEEVERKKKKNAKKRAKQKAKKAAAAAASSSTVQDEEEKEKLLERIENTP